MISLSDLPPEHKLRNTPLADIKAKYKHTSERTYREVLPSFGIAKRTYNELGVVWTKDTDFITEIEK